MIRTSSLLSSGCILQRNKENRIWGTAGKGVKLTLALEAEGKKLQELETTADAEGSFEFLLPAYEAGGPYTIRISDASEELCIEDVLFGDVFLLAGQSNMELPVRRTLDLTADHVKTINEDAIRQFEVPKMWDFHGPVDDIYEGCWKKADQTNVYEFSALGYFFAEKWKAEYGVPVGLLQTGCGGIQIEALIPEDKLLEIGKELVEDAIKRGETKEKNCHCGANGSCKFCYEEVIEKDHSDDHIRETMEADARRQEEYSSQLDANDRGLKEGWKDRSSLYEDGEAEIPTLTVPGRWEKLKKNAELEFLRGSVWVLKHFSLPEECVGKEGKLVFGTLIDADVTYINGTEVGRTEYRYPPRRYPVPAGVLKKENTLVSRVIVKQRAGGFVEEMPYYLECGDVKVSLEGEYEFRIGVNENPEFSTEPVELPDPTFFLYRPCGMYNRMIYPLRKLKLSGMLFYQGESNAMHYQEYEKLMILFAKNIRECFEDPELKMTFVELPMFGGEDKGRETNEWDELRFAQERATKQIPHASIADIYDLGFRYELHPQNKKEVAERVFEAFGKL